MTDEPIYADETMHRTWERRPKMRRKCPCCGGTSQYVGLAAGVVMIFGCKWMVRKWVQDPSATPTPTGEEADDG